MSDDSWRERYFRKAAPGEKQPYRAFTEEPVNRKQPARLRVEHHDGTLDLISYAFAPRLRFSADGLYASIFLTSEVFTLEGSGLTALAAPFQEDQIRELCCFNPSRHQPPAEGEPVITAISVQTYKEIEALSRK